MTKAKKLRELIFSPELSFLMEAHNGLSAKIAEEAGFQGLWGSGLSIAAQLGVRDNNEASWTQVLEVLEFMSDATSIPILVDGDTGHGNFNNVRRFVSKLEQRGIAGVCLEDKLFPKTNSFIDGDRQQLADIHEFCGKIKAGKDVLRDPDFVIVARLEAFIAGWGLTEAMHRAHAYVEAGADAILVHSKKQTPEDLEAFLKEWNHSVPIVIVPTKYFSTPTDYFRELGVQTVIWANHSIRAATRAMQATTRRIFNEQTLINIEESIAPLNEIFRLQNAAELQSAETHYLPAHTIPINAIILAASRGSAFGSLTESVPKALLPVHGKPIIDHITSAFRRAEIKDITVVRGYKKNAFTDTDLTYVDNDAYDTSKEVASLHAACRAIKQNTIISFGDIIFKEYFISELLQSEAPITILAIPRIVTASGYRDLIKTTRPYTPVAFNESSLLEVMSSTLTPDEATGEFTGLWYVQNEGATLLQEALNVLYAQSTFTSARISDLFTVLQGTSTIAVRYLEGGWIDIDSVPELIEAGSLK